LPLPSNDENLIRDGLQFKRDLGSPRSSLSCYREGLYLLREFNITKAKKAHSRKDEERASYFMGVVDGIDQAIEHPEKMVRRWESLAQEEMAKSSFRGSSSDGE